MKNNFMVLPVCIGLTVLWNPVHAQWVQTNGPCGGNVRSLAVTGDTVFTVIDKEGAFRFVDDGAGWIPTDFGLSEKIYRLMAFGETYLAAQTYSNWYISSDNGAAWKKVDSSLYIRNVKAFAAMDSTIFMGTEENGLYRSTDGGSTWTALIANGIYSLAAVGSSILVGTKGDGVSRLSNNGASWQRVNADFSKRDVYVFAVNGDTVFAGAGADVWHSTDGGMHWTADTGLSGKPIRSLAITGNTILAGTGDGTGGGVFRLSGNGSDWVAASAGLTNTPVEFLSVAGNAVYAGTAGSGIFRSTDGGAQWIAVNDGLPYTAVRSLAVMNTTLFAGTDGGGVFRSADNGTSWDMVSSGITNSIIRALAVCGTTVYAGGEFDGLFRSTDSGANWSAVDIGPYDRLRVHSLAVDGGTVYVGTADGIVFLADGGSTWISTLPSVTVLAMAVSDGRIFAGSYIGVHLSTDHGTGWNVMTADLRNARTTALAVRGETIFAGIGPKSAAHDQIILNGGITVSTDNGANWSPKDFGSDGSSIFEPTSLAMIGGNVFAGTYGSGILLLTGNGTTSTSVKTGLPGSAIFSLAVCGGNLFAGTWGNGVWRRPLSEMIDSTAIRSQPGKKQQADFRLHTPGRGDSRLSVEFSLPHPEHVTVKIFDLIGRETATLVDRRFDAGAYSLLQHTNAFAQGCYAVRLQAGATARTGIVRIMH